MHVALRSQWLENALSQVAVQAVYIYIYIQVYIYIYIQGVPKNINRFKNDILSLKKDDIMQIEMLRNSASAPPQKSPGENFDEVGSSKQLQILVDEVVFYILRAW